jgi:hypothetical protein
MPAKKIFQVGPNQVRVRRQPGLQGEMVRWLDPGTQLECDALSRREADGYVWWQHSHGWSAERSTSGSEVYLFEAVAAPTPSTPDKKLFRAGSVQVRVREEPHLRGMMVRWIQPGELVEVQAGSRREADGYVWWQHADGWSAERSVDGESVFLIDVPPTPVATPVPVPAAAAPAAPTPTPAGPSPTPAQPPAGREFQPPPPRKPFKVASVKVRVRAEPNLQGRMIRWIDPGTLLEVDGNSRIEVDGYVWWRHNEGWSAERNLAGSEVYLVDPSVVVDIPAPRTNEPPTVDMLPLRDALFIRLPVDFGRTLWWQYFGNNVYARRIWMQGLQWYKYAQGLHGGLDFGNSRERGVPVYAGVNGTFKFHDRANTRPNGLWVKVGDYTVIYGHLANPRLYRVGDPIGPDTLLGELDFGGQNHLHLEVRYRDRWIINPLLLMPEDMRDNLIRKFPPSSDYFWRDAGWNQWQTPLDQPIITLGGPIIGPNAG